VQQFERGAAASAVMVPRCLPVATGVVTAAAAAAARAARAHSTGLGGRRSIPTAPLVLLNGGAVGVRGVDMMEVPPGWKGFHVDLLEARARYNAATLMLGRSRIDGTGLFVTADVEMDDVIAEYTGELVDNEVCDLREAYYEAHGMADYMFRLGVNEVADATIRGCRARYINHSCDPNCFAVITIPEVAPPGTATDDGLTYRPAAPAAAALPGGAAAPGGGVGYGSETETDDDMARQVRAPADDVPSAPAPAPPPPPPREPRVYKRVPRTGRRVFVYALRHIRAGEELTYDYQFPADERQVPCKCGAPCCRGTLNMQE